MIVDKPFYFDDYVRPTRLRPTKNWYNRFEGGIMVASGMGKINNNESTSQLKIASIQMLQKNECKKLFENTFRLPYEGRRSDLNMIFLFSYSDGVICGKDIANTCSGDSGGPVVANIDGLFTLIGITSFGEINTCRRNQVGYYTDISFPENFDFIYIVN